MSDAANRIREAAGANNNDDARTLAFVAIRDGEAWNDRRLPEMGRALSAALDIIEEQEAENQRLRRERDREHARFMGRHDAAVDWQLRAEAAEARCARLEAALRDFVDCADWYRRCLEDVVDRRPVRGLDEAMVGYDQMLRVAREALADQKEGNA